MLLLHRERLREEKPHDLSEVTVQKSQGPDVNPSQSWCPNPPDHAVSYSNSKEATSLTLEGTSGPELHKLQNPRLSTKSKLSFLCPQKSWSCGSPAILLQLHAHGTPN